VVVCTVQLRLRVCLYDTNAVIARPIAPTIVSCKLAVINPVTQTVSALPANLINFTKLICLCKMHMNTVWQKIYYCNPE